MKKKTDITDDEMYEKVEFDGDAVVEARRLSKLPKRPTSVALEDVTIQALRELAQERGIPYQVLMRSYIVDGIRRDKKKIID